jgi:hypothetical protein
MTMAENPEAIRREEARASAAVALMEAVEVTPAEDTANETGT